MRMSRYANDVDDMIDFADRYEKNRESVMASLWRRDIELPPWGELSAQAIRVGEFEFSYKTDGGISTPCVIHRTKEITRPLFTDLSKPLLLENEMNSYHWEYLMDNVRSSEDYGSDNHIYMHYDSPEIFYLLLQTVDITPYLNSGKFVILIGDDLSIYTNIKSDGGCHNPSPVKINEINRAVVCMANRGFSGNLFFAGVLDQHPSLLTMADFGMSDFYALYRNLLENKTVNEVLEQLNNHVSNLSYKCLNQIFSPVSVYHTVKLKIPNYSDFTSILNSLFSYPYQPTSLEWLKGIFLSYNLALGRKFTNRVAPVLCVQTHSNFVDYLHQPFSLQGLLAIIYQMKYVNCISIVRNMTISAASALKSFVDSFMDRKKAFMDTPCLLSMFDNIFSAEDKTLHIDKFVRFEDLKKCPRAELYALCDYLDIPFSESLLSVTANGTEVVTNMGSRFKIKGYDTAPVVNYHKDVCNEFDHFRLEILANDDLKKHGYTNRYYTDAHNYTADEALDLCKEPFECEKYMYTGGQLAKANDARSYLYRCIQQKFKKCSTT